MKVILGYCFAMVCVFLLMTEAPKLFKGATGPLQASKPVLWVETVDTGYGIVSRAVLVNPDGTKVSCKVTSNETGGEMVCE